MLSRSWTIRKHLPAIQPLPPSWLITALLLLVSPALADFELNLPKGVTPVSNTIYDLHMYIFWVCVVIAVIVFGVMTWSIIHHRQSKGVKAASFRHNTALEVVWTIIPLLVLVAIAIPATRALVNLENTEKADMTVKITGYQWKWQYEYLDNGISFFSNLMQQSRDASYDKNLRDQTAFYLLDVDKRLVLPVNTRIRFLMTSNDVIHSWWVHEIGVKQDANPGFINDAWATIEKPGVYRGQCAELCGKGHGYMPIVVEAVSKQDYANWVRQQKSGAQAIAAQGAREWSKDELMVQGQKVYSSTCAACHKVTGEGLPGVFPALKGSKIATGDLNAHLNIVLHGKAGTAMQAFADQLSDSDLASVITYERNAFGNSTGDVVQPSMIKAAR